MCGNNEQLPILRRRSKSRWLQSSLFKTYNPLAALDNGEIQAQSRSAVPGRVGLLLPAGADLVYLTENLSARRPFDRGRQALQPMCNCRCRALWILHFSTPDSFPQICEPCHVGQDQDQEVPCTMPNSQRCNTAFPTFFSRPSTLLHPFLPSTPSFLRSACLCSQGTPFQRPEAGPRQGQGVAMSRAPVKLIDWPETCSRAQRESRRYRTKGQPRAEAKVRSDRSSRAISPANQLAPYTRRPSREEKAE